MLEEGIASLLRDGYHGTGLKALLDRVQVPKGSFYNYFESKEDFAVASVERYAQCIFRQFESAFEDAPDAVSGLRSFFRGQMDEFVEAGFVGGCLVANLAGELEGSDACREVLRTSMQGYRDGLLKAIQVGQADGDLRSDLSAEAMADLLMSAWEGAVIRMKVERSLEPLDLCLEQLLDGYFHPSAATSNKRTRKASSSSSRR